MKKRKGTDVVTLVQFLLLISLTSPPFWKFTSFDETWKREVTLD